jgi:Tol biopolymer transport system component
MRLPIIALVALFGFAACLPTGSIGAIDTTYEAELLDAGTNAGSIANCDHTPSVHTVIHESGPRAFPAVRWNHTTDTLTLMKTGDDGYYDVWLTDPLFTKLVPLTENNPLLPNRHIGNEDWHPSGEYLALVVEKPDHPGSSLDALPGFGGYSDVWLITRSGDRAWQFTDVPNDYDHGVLFPRFSPDGTKLVWTERIAAPNLLDPMLRAGGWVIKVAEFMEQPEPHLENIATFQPGGSAAFNEATGWSADSRTVVFSSDFQTGDLLQNQIYALDVQTHMISRLTHDNAYHEHPDFTPDGAHVIWMTTRDATGAWGVIGTDWWIMDPDGSNPRRLTLFEEPGSSHFEGAARWPGQFAFDPTGSWFLGGVLTDLVEMKGELVVVSCD